MCALRMIVRLLLRVRRLSRCAVCVLCMAARCVRVDWWVTVLMRSELCLLLCVDACCCVLLRVRECCCALLRGVRLLLCCGWFLKLATRDHARWVRLLRNASGTRTMQSLYETAGSNRMAVET